MSDEPNKREHQHAITLCIYRDADVHIALPTLGGELLGGEVTAMACYDLFEAMEIAEDALEAGDEDDCREAMAKINLLIKRALLPANTTNQDENKEPIDGDHQ